MGIIDTNKDRMIDLLLSGVAVSEIAKVLNVSRQTIYAWKEITEVKAELERRRTHIKKTAQDKIISNVTTCIENMYDMANQKTDQRVRFQANKYIIDQALGSPSSSNKEQITSTGLDNSVMDKNNLKEEIEDIKKLKII